MASSKSPKGSPQQSGGKPDEPEKAEELAEDASQAVEQPETAGKARTPKKGKKADSEATEEKPKRARRAKAKAEEKADDGGDAGKDEADEQLEQKRAADSEAMADEDLEEPGKKPSGGRRRRGAAETSTGAGSQRRTRRAADPDVTVRARARYVRTAPRKARLVVEHIRGKSVDEARAILRNTPRAASKDVLKLLESCVANAENNHELDPDELRIGQAFVDEGPTIKRYRPRALGRATRINKRTSHMTITLVSK